MNQKEYKLHFGIMFCARHMKQSHVWKGQKRSECLKRTHWFNVTVNAFVKRE